MSEHAASSQSCFLSCAANASSAVSKFAAAALLTAWPLASALPLAFSGLSAPPALMLPPQAAPRTEKLTSTSVLKRVISVSPKILKSDGGPRRQTPSAADRSLLALLAGLLVRLVRLVRLVARVLVGRRLRRVVLLWRG